MKLIFLHAGNHQSFSYVDPIIFDWFGLACPIYLKEQIPISCKSHAKLF